MGLAHRASLLRRLAVLTEIARDKVRRREILREKSAVWETIRAALAAARIDPRRIEILWPVTSAAAELTRLGDTPALRRADAAFVAQDRVLSSREGYAAKAAGRVTDFAARPPPRPGASLFDWYAWSLARLHERPLAAPAAGAIILA